MHIRCQSCGEYHCVHRGALQWIPHKLGTERILYLTKILSLLPLYLHELFLSVRKRCIIWIIWRVAAGTGTTPGERVGIVLVASAWVRQHLVCLRHLHAVHGNIRMNGGGGCHSHGHNCTFLALSAPSIIPRPGTLAGENWCHWSMHIKNTPTEHCGTRSTVLMCVAV